MDRIIKTIDNDRRIIEFKKKKNELLNNEDLIFKINKMKKLDKYSMEYKKIKLELFQNPVFVEYKQLENEIDLLVLEINEKLRTLTDKKGCI